MSFELAVLKTREMAVVPYAERYAALSARLGLTFEATQFAISHIPLCLRDPAHGAARKTIAKLINSSQPIVDEQLRGLVERYAAPLASPGQCDVHGDVVVPLVDRLLSALIGVRLDLSPDSPISQLFSMSIGPRRRQRMEAELSRILASLRAAFPDQDDQTIGMRLALAILGRDALLGTLSNSLHALFADADGAPLGAIRYPDLPPRTGVPYVDREALQDIDIAGVHFAQGDVYRVRLDTLEQAANPSDRRSFFGAGAHLCLGRPVSISLWQSLTRHLSTLPTTVRVEAMTLRKDDVFVIPSTFRVQVSLP